MKAFFKTTTLLLMGSTLISGWRFTWDVNSASGDRNQPLCMSISHRCGDKELHRERCDKPRDPAYYQWDDESRDQDEREKCHLTIYSDSNCETGRGENGRDNKSYQTVYGKKSADTEGNWEIKAYTVDGCKDRGNNGPPDNGPPHHDDPPHEEPRCHWEEGKRRGEEGHCEGGEECRRRRRRDECERR